MGEQTGKEQADYISFRLYRTLGHSDFAITANTYAHLEFDSKLAAANAMTWIDKTSLGQAQGSVAGWKEPAHTKSQQTAWLLAFRTEAERFELPWGCPQTVFKTAAL